MGYEWFKEYAVTLGQQSPELAALSGPGLQTPGTRPATKEELYGFFDHLERELDDAGFFKTEKKKPTMRLNLRNMFVRAELTEQRFAPCVEWCLLSRAHLRRKGSKE